MTGACDWLVDQEKDELPGTGRHGSTGTDYEVHRRRACDTFGTSEDLSLSGRPGSSHLQPAGLDRMLDRRHHLLDVISDVLLAGTLEWDLGAHNAHKHSHLTRAVSVRVRQKTKNSSN